MKLSRPRKTMSAGVGPGGNEPGTDAGTRRLPQRLLPQRWPPQRLLPQRWPPQRRALLIGSAAGVLGAAAAVVIAVSARPGGQEPRYASLPPPCALVTATALAEVLPGATASSLSPPASGVHQEGACAWSAFSGRQERTVFARIDIYGSTSGVAHAQQDFRTAFHSPGRNTAGYAIATQSVTAVGNQAQAHFLDGTGAGTGRTLVLLVQTGNAVVGVEYVITPTGPAVPLPDRASRLATAIMITRGIMTALADPAGIPKGAPAAAPLARPQYARPPGSCRLVSASTFAKVLPGASLFQASAPQPATSSYAPWQVTCGWSTTDDAELSVVVTVYGPRTMLTAQQNYEFGSQQDGQGQTQAGTKTTVNRILPLAGVGTQATVIAQTQTSPLQGTSQLTELLAWSGNAELDITASYGVPALGSPAPPPRAAQLSTVTAIARDVLAALPRT